MDEFMETLIALQDRLNTRRAVPLAGSKATELGQAPHHLAECRRGLRRVAVILHSIDGVPLLRFQPHITGHFGIDAASHRDIVDPPRHHEIERNGVQQSLIRLHASRLDLTPVLERPKKQLDVMVATHHTIALVVQTSVDKLTREMRTASRLCARRGLSPP
jgi:hypothetical protein